MSERDEELELQALQRELDDAFATTRPRSRFDDELWLRMQAKRPLGARVRDAFAGLMQGIREVPKVPVAAIAGILLVLLSVGILSNGLRGGGGGATSATLGGADQASRNSSQGFGALPAPSLPKSTDLGPTTPEYVGPAQYEFAGNLVVATGTAPVFRYQEPSTNAADQFAAALGAALRDRPPGLLGSYSATTYTLKVRGTVQSPASSPAYFILANLVMPASDAAGAAPQDLAAIFLAQHSLAPQWTYTVSVDSAGDPIKVVYERQFDVPGYGSAHLVDGNGTRYGLEVDLSGRRPVLVTGLLPVSLESATYRIISADQAVRLATASSSAVSASPAPTVQLTQAELVYVLVPAGDHSFYEPAFLFSGTFKLNGTTMTKHVLVAAVDPSQRVP